MTKFISITDQKCFLGSLLGIRSLLETHTWVSPSQITIGYILHHRDHIEAAQLKYLRNLGVNVVTNEDLFVGDRYAGPWEAKTYLFRNTAMESNNGDIIVLFDADLFFCRDTGSVIGSINSSHLSIAGGKDRDIEYGPNYSIYGITPAKNDCYMSTSCMFLEVTDFTRDILKHAEEVTQHAEYNGQGPYKGHGDQGVINACIFAAKQKHPEAIRTLALPDALWSHHWTAKEDIFRRTSTGMLLNLNYKNGDHPIFTFHRSGPFPKPWSPNFWTPNRLAHLWAIVVAAGHIEESDKDLLTENTQIIVERAKELVQLFA